MSDEKAKTEYSADSVQNVVNSLFDEVSEIKNQLKDSKSNLDENKIADIVKNVHNQSRAEEQLLVDQDRSYSNVLSAVKDVYQKAGVEFDPTMDETQIINNYASFANLESSNAEKEKRDFNFKNVEKLTVHEIKKQIDKFSGKGSSTKTETSEKKVEPKKSGTMSLASEGEDVGTQEELDDIAEEIQKLDKLSEKNPSKAEGRRMVLLANLQILKQKMMAQKEKNKSFFG